MKDLLQKVFEEAQTKPDVYVEFLRGAETIAKENPQNKGDLVTEMMVVAIDKGVTNFYSALIEASFKEIIEKNKSYIYEHAKDGSELAPVFLTCLEQHFIAKGFDTEQKQQFFNEAFDRLTDQEKVTSRGEILKNLISPAHFEEYDQTILQKDYQLFTPKNLAVNEVQAQLIVLTEADAQFKILVEQCKHIQDFVVSKFPFSNETKQQMCKTMLEENERGVEELHQLNKKVVNLLVENNQLSVCGIFLEEVKAKDLKLIDYQVDAEMAVLDLAPNKQVHMASSSTKSVNQFTQLGESIGEASLKSTRDFMSYAKPLSLDDSFVLQETSNFHKNSTPLNAIANQLEELLWEQKYGTKSPSSPKSPLGENLTSSIASTVVDPSSANSSRSVSPVSVNSDDDAAKIGNKSSPKPIKPETPKSFVEKVRERELKTRQSISQTSKS